MKKVCVCAHFGKGKELLNGQSIKAKIITKEIERRLGKNRVVRIDTHGALFAIVKLSLQLLRASVICSSVIIMPGRNGLKVFVPLLRLYSVLFRTKTHYIVIGGWLCNYLHKHTFIKKRLYNFDHIYVETKEMKNDLERIGLRNIVFMTNCKELHIMTEPELIYSHCAPYKLCTFSRVIEEKGIEDAIAAVSNINTKEEKTVYTLDIYGPIDDNYRSRFDEIKVSFPGYIKYSGTIPYDKTTEVIRNYFLMLFPTHYETEGLPGTLIDAYASGVPVVASDWRYSGEFIPDDVGYIYGFKDTFALTDLLDSLKDTPAAVNAKKSACIERALLYSSERVLSILIDRLD